MYTCILVLHFSAMEWEIDEVYQGLIKPGGIEPRIKVHITWEVKIPEWCPNQVRTLVMWPHRGHLCVVCITQYDLSAAQNREGNMHYCLRIIKINEYICTCTFICIVTS